MTRRRKMILGLVGTAAAAAVGVPLFAFSAPGSPLLPDLVSDPPDGARFATYDTVHGHSALLLRFNGYVHNEGDGPLDVQGNPQKAMGTPGAMDQYVWNGSGSRTSDASTNPGAWTRVTDHPRDPEVVYDGTDTHSHFHVQRIAEYAMWNEAKTALVMPGSKVGFCQYDSQWMGAKGPAAAVYGDTITGGFCHQYDPGATQLREGISEGYRDIYDWTLDLQWVDITNIVPGRYYLSARMDPENVIKEKREDNNSYAFSDKPVVVPGYTVRAAAPVNTPYRTKATVSLAADGFRASPPVVPSGQPTDTYGTVLGAPAFRIESLPKNGQLTTTGGQVLGVGSVVPGTAGAGQASAAAQIVYVPNANFSGADGFTYSARDTSSSYPQQPAQATATISVGGSGLAMVGLSGAPGQMVVGAQAQLVATSSNNGAVVWTTSAGTISPSGLLTAPATVPAGGSITVRAALADDLGAFREVTIPVVASGLTEPAPVVPPPATTTALSVPGVLLGGRRVTITMHTNEAGVLRVALTKGGRTLAVCNNRTVQGQDVSCRFTMRQAYDPASIGVVATLRLDSGGTATQKSTLGPSNFRRFATRRSHGRATVVITPQRPGFANVVFTAGGHTVAQCAQHVRPNASLTCVRSVGNRAVTVTVRFRDNQGRLAVRDAKLGAR